MKIYITIFFFVMLTSSMFSQGETPEKTVPIPAVESKEDKKEPAPKPILIQPENKPSLTDINKNNISGITVKNPATIKKSEEEFSMFDNSTLIDPGTIYEKKWKDERISLEKEARYIPNIVGDQFFGDFKITGEFANVICRDFGAEDGDIVRVLVNDEVIITNLTLTNGYKSFKVPLVEGINKIDFLALNQGDSGPNTAEFHVYDDNEVLISAKEWNLLTGMKAIIVVIKE